MLINATAPKLDEATYRAELPSPPKIEGVSALHCPGRPGYAVSDDGRVFTCKNARWGYRNEWKQMTPTSDKFGYLLVGCGIVRGANKSRQPVRIQKLVLEAFVGPMPTGHHACHGDGNPRNNCLSNLRWGTVSENVMDAVRHGTAARSLSDTHVRAIRDAKGMEPQTVTGIRFGVSQVLISQIQRGKIYSHVL